MVEELLKVSPTTLLSAIKIRDTLEIDVTLEHSLLSARDSSRASILIRVDLSSHSCSRLSSNTISTSALKGGQHNCSQLITSQSKPWYLKWFTLVFETMLVFRVGFFKASSSGFRFEFHNAQGSSVRCRYGGQQLLRNVFYHATDSEEGKRW